MNENWTHKKVKDVCEKASSNIVLNKFENNVGDYALYGASGLVKGVDFYHRDEPYIGIVKDGSGVGRVDVYPAKSSLVGTMQYILPKKDCSLKFLCYALQSLKLSDFVTGAAIPHIYFRDYGECIIPVPPLATQSRIVSELDLLQSIIDKQKAQLKELDNLAQAVFYDMFGVFDVPKFTLLELCNSKNDIKCGPFGTQLSKDEYKKNGIAVWGIPQINSHFTLSPSDFVTEEKASYLKDFSVIAGDIVMSRKGNVGQCCVFPESFASGIIHSDVLRLRLNSQKANSTFMMFQLHLSEDVKHQIQLVSSGAIMPGINVTKLKNIKVVVPPLSLQQSFAAKIESIEKQKAAISKSIEETQKLFDYTMDKYFG